MRRDIKGTPQRRSQVHSNHQSWTIESPLEELLLASDSKKKSLPSEEQDQLFDLYITPYTEKQLHEARQSSELYNQDTTILRGLHQGEAQPHFNNNQNPEVARLKRLVDKKNGVIGELTDELRVVKQDLLRRIRRKSKRQNRPKDIMAQQDCSAVKKEIDFFRKNNLELFEELSRCRLEKETLKQQFQTLQTSMLEAQKKLKESDQINKRLASQNDSLLRQIKTYIDSGRKEMKYVSKMRDILIQRTGIKNFQVEVSSAKEPRRLKGEGRPKKSTNVDRSISDLLTQSEGRRRSSERQLPKHLSMQMLQRYEQLYVQ